VAVNWQKFIESGEGIGLGHVVAHDDGQDEVVDVLLVKAQVLAEVSEPVSFDFSGKCASENEGGREILEAVSGGGCFCFVDLACEVEEEVLGCVVGEPVVDH
jgi:hypothetical protein